MQTGLVQITHPSYFGLFNPTPTFPAQIADRLAATFNPQLATATTSPAAVAIENHVVRAVAKQAGLIDTARGHFTSGGTEANFTATVMALTAACPEFGQKGARAFTGSPIFYVSRDSHQAWLKIAHQCGIGRTAMRFVDTDDQGRLDINKLSEMIEKDKKIGCTPFMIVATAGTTNAGMIDPLVECGQIARQNNLWFHVDAAWGGGLIASTKYKHHLAGIQHADSVTIDAHKWFATTMGCGIFITQRSSLIESTFHALNSYMPSSNVDVDPYISSVQWSRRFVGLRLFLALATVGWDGYGKHFEQMLMMSELLKFQLKAWGLLVVNESPVGVLCIVPKNKNAVRQIVNHVVSTGNAWVSTAVFNQQDVIRACVTSGLTTPSHISDLVTTLVEADTIVSTGA
ncbi:unnamed protein product [Sphagnum tenellum]